MLLFSSAAFAQTANTVFGAGYSLPVPINAAPGQILNLFVQGVGASLTQRVTATSLPLPTILAGISAQLEQAYTPRSVAVPLLAVRPVSTCVNGAFTSAACGHYAVITVEIPFELVPNQRCGPCDPVPVPNPQIIVSENGLAGGAIDLNPVADQVHVANFCDIDTAASQACGATPLIAHADGTLVSAASPAKAGEEVVIYALGLGATKLAAPTGQATPSPAPTTQTQFQLNFDYQPNAAPSRGVIGSGLPSACEVTCLPSPLLFSGLTPNSVSLYQLNFIVPVPPQGTPACQPGIASNLTVTAVGSTSFDGAGICVAISTSGTATTSSTAAAQATASSDSTVPLGSFVPNAIWFPTRVGLTELGQPLPPISIGSPGPFSAAK